MVSVPEEFEEFSANDLLEALDGKIDLVSNRIVGFYVEVGGSQPLGFGVEGVYFRGVDTQNGDLVEAYYIGGTVGASVGLGTLGTGIFGYEGDPDGFGGISVGVQGSSFATTGFSISRDGSILHFLGANSSLAVNGAIGLTYSVSVNGQNIYSFGLPFTDGNPFEPDPEFVADYVKAAQVIVGQMAFGRSDSEAAQDIVSSIASFLQDEGIAPNQLLFDPEGEDFASAMTTLAAYLARTNSDMSPEDVVRTGLLNQALETLTSSFALHELPGKFIDLGLGAFIPKSYHCFSAGTPVTLWGGRQKPIEEISAEEFVLSHDATGTPVPGRVTKLFRNTTSEFIRLTFGDREDLIATPGHRFLTETGDYMKIGHMLRLGGGAARVVDSSGATIEARGT
ncbi:intein N-terminal splicing region [Roseovarius azorensis]|uniref:Intein N-terminal splicing region n=1 Tax=Roseovarius azorensis TaxID=1287727 RepID=A0A1H7R516_9RHOB|nr:Hint domain-containing protein [Roseovarius azorensis]SEL55376.1 intein N-terminal splicing region [Roseovarius azorensis]